MLVAQLCLTDCDLMDCKLPGTSVYGILQARILEWVAVPFSRRSSWPGNQTPRSPALQTDSLPSEPPGEPKEYVCTCKVGHCCSVTQSCLTLWNTMDCSIPGFPVLPCLPEFDQTHVHWVNDAIQPSPSVTPFYSCSQCFTASGSFPVSWLFESGGQSIGTSASSSVLPMNIQGFL